MGGQRKEKPRQKTKLTIIQLQLLLAGSSKIVFFQACFKFSFASFPLCGFLAAPSSFSVSLYSGRVASPPSPPTASFLYCPFRYHSNKGRKREWVGGGGGGVEQNHTAAGFPSVSLKSLSYKFTALSIITSLGHLWGAALFQSGLQEDAADQIKSVCLFTSGYLGVQLCSLSAAPSSPGWLICWGGDVALRLVIKRSASPLSLTYSLWQCNTKVWIAFFFFFCFSIFDFIWVHNGKKRWVRCRFFLGSLAR